MIPTQVAEQFEASNEESANFNNSLMKPVADHEVVPSSRTTSFIEDSFAQNRASTEKDGNWFLDQLNRTTIDIQQKIDLTEKLLEEQQQLMSDDISGKLRAAVGKANLLITQKFNQFKELCLKNIVSH
jgi:discs large-associated protein 1